MEAVGAHGALFCEPLHWSLCFSRRTDSAWVNRLVWGEFKHVRAFGYVPLEGVWVFVDVTLRGTFIKAARDGTQMADALISRWIEDCAVVRIAARPARVSLPAWFCTAAMKQLVRIDSGALRPDALWRDCLRQGGKVLDENQRARPAASAGDPARSAA